VERPRNIVEEAAERLARGEVIGWFQGRMELGPRALGNRSILADPRSVSTRDRVNRLKGREQWRPLAPAVTAEASDLYFDLPFESPFMLLATSVRDRTRQGAPAVVHIDQSARPQTVRRDQNAVFHQLLTAFERRSGLPILMNTSFNTSDEPIVCSPDDAISSFLEMGLDSLVCGDLLLTDRRKG
jgi:carbamoyltransferase